MSKVRIPLAAAGDAATHACLRVSFQIGYGLAPAIVITFAVAVPIPLLAGVYYATARKEGVSFREAVFNWRLVILTGLVAILRRVQA